MKNPITIKTARIVAPCCLEIAWKTGETLRANLSAQTSPPFDTWNDPAFFAQMTVEAWGGHGLSTGRTASAWAPTGSTNSAESRLACRRLAPSTPGCSEIASPSPEPRKPWA